MGIDEVRMIIYEAYLKPIHEDKRSFIIAYAGLTLDAQNALLKLLEDPPVTAQFFIIIGQHPIQLHPQQESKPPIQRTLESNP